MRDSNSNDSAIHKVNAIENWFVFHEVWDTSWTVSALIQTPWKIFGLFWPIDYIDLQIVCVGYQARNQVRWWWKTDIRDLNVYKKYFQGLPGWQITMSAACGLKNNFRATFRLQQCKSKWSSIFRFWSNSFVMLSWERITETNLQIGKITAVGNCDESTGKPHDKAAYGYQPISSNYADSEVSKTELHWSRWTSAMNLDLINIHTHGKCMGFVSF